LPLARRDDLLVEEVEDELVIYDKRSDSAHRLNRTAAIVWRHCDGENDVPGLKKVLETELGTDVVDDDLVMIALDSLAERDLIEGAPRREPEETRVSRRRFIRRVGTVGVAALALPVITSLTAPTPASAQGSCLCECYCECYCYFCYGGCDPCTCPCGCGPVSAGAAAQQRRSPRQRRSPGK
jgi:hypothetical protein